MEIEYRMFCWLLSINGLFLGTLIARLSNKQPIAAFVLSVVLLAFSFGSVPFTYNFGQVAHSDTLGRVLDAVVHLAAPTGGYGLATASVSLYQNSKRKGLSPKARQGAV